MLKIINDNLLKLIIVQHLFAENEGISELRKNICEIDDSKKILLLMFLEETTMKLNYSYKNSSNTHILNSESIN